MYKVSSTSAFVLLLTDESVYESTSAKKLWNNLDLEAARPFVEEAISAWDGIPPEEITNRKWGIKKFSNEFLTVTPDSQVIFLGAGLDPKSLDVAESFPRSKVFDVDMDNMDLKREMTKSINGPSNIAFCQANIGNTDQLLSTLTQNGLNPDKVTLIVAEGISYYIPKEQFKNTLQVLRSPNGGLVLEYSIPTKEVKSKEDHPRINRLFDLLQKRLALPNPLERYTVDEIQKLANELKTAAPPHLS